MPTSSQHLNIPRLCGSSRLGPCSLKIHSSSANRKTKHCHNPNSLFSALPEGLCQDGLLKELLKHVALLGLRFQAQQQDCGHAQVSSCRNICTPASMSKYRRPPSCQEAPSFPVPQGERLDFISQDVKVCMPQIVLTNSINHAKLSMAGFARSTRSSLRSRHVSLPDSS